MVEAWLDGRGVVPAAWVVGPLVLSLLSSIVLLTPPVTSRNRICPGTDSPSEAAQEIPKRPRAAAGKPRASLVGDPDLWLAT